MKNSTKNKLKNLCLAAMFLALGLVLPLLTGQLPQIGSMLLPMHIPVLICGLVCGWQYGFFVGLVLPLLRMSIFGMPPFITALAMTFELATYGLVAGLIYGASRWQCLRALYRSLIAAMIAGRAVWGLAMLVITGVTADTFTLNIFLSSAILNAIPGIILQLVLIPVLMLALDKAGLYRFRRKDPGAEAEAPDAA